MVRQVSPRRALAPVASRARGRLAGRASSPRRPRALLAACAALALAFAAAGCAAEATPPAVPAPPEPLSEFVQAQPAPGMVWMPGCWHWDGEGYVWLPGHWTAPAE